jgi:para-nitrobenzyl esterase
MVWIHGGGWTSGSGQELLAYDGESLCRRGDVVVVGFNHRLNVFGFLNLSDFGPEYATSGNAGFTDLIFVLQWVRDNIANFGGDPANVTIMGQSGGGSKVNALLATPSAKGLFHKASIHSGSSLRVLDAETSMRTAAAVLAELGITKANADKLHTITTQQLLEAGLAATRRGGPRAAPIPGAPRPTARFGYGAYLDGTIIPNQHQTWDPAAPEISADIPIMVGTVLNEMVTAVDKSDAFSLTLDQLKTQLTPNFGTHAAEVIDAFQKGHPKANPFQLSSIITASGGARTNAVTQSQRKAALGKAPAYNFWFTWQPPILEGRPMAFHCADLSFFFDNMERCETMTGNGPDARKLSAQMSEAWIAFAKTGNPNHPGIPKWSPVTPNGSETMIFDSPSTFSATADTEERKVLAASRQPLRT